MKHISYLLIFMLVLVVTSDDQNEEETGRIFPLLPPYQGVDFLQNWRTLATVQNAIFTLLKSTITLVGVNLMWIVLHAIFWDGNAATVRDVTDSLLTPGVRIDLVGNTESDDTSRIFQNPNRNLYNTPPQARIDPSNYQKYNQNYYYKQNQLINNKLEAPTQKSYRRVDNGAVYAVYPSSSINNLQGQSKVTNSKLSKAQDRISLDSLDTLINSFENELSLEKLWNFFADPDTSTRNLWLNIGFTLGSHIVYILPTYFGTVDAPEVKSDFPVLSSGIENEPLRIWNKLFCPQCIYNTVALNTVVWIGKTLWWTFMSSIPDVVGFGPEDEEGNLPRMFPEISDDGIIETISKTFIENINEKIFTMKWMDSINFVT